MDKIYWIRALIGYEKEGGYGFRGSIKEGHYGGTKRRTNESREYTQFLTPSRLCAQDDKNLLDSAYAKDI